MAGGAYWAPRSVFHEHEETQAHPEGVMISNYDGSLSCACPHNERQLPQKDQNAKNPTKQTIWFS